MADAMKILCHGSRFIGSVLSVLPYFCTLLLYSQRSKYIHTYIHTYIPRIEKKERKKERKKEGKKSKKEKQRALVPDTCHTRVSTV